MDQLFSVRQGSEEYLENTKDQFWAFMYLENSYCTIDLNPMLAVAKNALS